MAAWILAVAAISTAAGSPLTSDPQVFLEKFGYLHQDNHIHNAAEMKTAIREFQWLSRLPVTGKLDSATMRRMSEPRCGVSDEGSQQIWAQRVNAIFTGKSRDLRHRKRRSALQERVCNVRGMQRRLKFAAVSSCRYLKCSFW